MDDINDIPAEEVLAWALRTFGDSLAICSSFQKEGMVVIDMAVRQKTDVRVFTLDTGLLPKETVQFIGTVEARYGIRVERVRPEPLELAQMVERHGPELFYQDVPRRMLCCEIRKVRPLGQKMQSLKAWVTGLRRSQNVSRAGVKKADCSRGVYRISPLADWTREQVEDYILRCGVPVHPLYFRGYQSIGCGPCTRAVSEGEEERAGRWWWERDAHKECGIHFSASGKAEREVDVLLKEILDAQPA